MWLALLGILALGAGAAYAGQQHLKAKPFEYDPEKTYLVQAEWLTGIGCPTDARTAEYGPAPDYPIGAGPRYTDPACPTGDRDDRKNEGLLLAKTGPTANVASAGAVIHGVKGQVLTELGYDIRKPGTDTSAGPRGSHCGAGAPRFNVETTDGGFYFIGCNSPPAVVQQPGAGFIRLRWGGAVPLMAYNASTGLPQNIRGMRVKSVTIVFDEGYDTGPTNFGLAVLDNIDVNGVLIGEGAGERGDRDEDDDDHDRGHGNDSRDDD